MWPVRWRPALTAASRRCAPVPAAGVRFRQSMSAVDAALAKAAPGARALVETLEEAGDGIPIHRMRNFCIVAHVDHGKSTVADRLLESTANILPTSSDHQQVLDTLQVERERGITVKAQTASLLYTDGANGGSAAHVLNLIDTPGHVDFSYEVSRSMAACEGALLLVDCAQGVQAQTVANWHAVQSAGLDVVPVLTKIDLPTADPELCLDQMQSLFGIDPDAVLWTSAKSGEGIDDLLPAVVERVRPPAGVRDAPVRCLLFDSWFDEFRGVICIVSVVDGEVSPGMVLQAMSTSARYTVQEVGVVTPMRFPVSRLMAGQVGYVIVGMKETREAKVGDTLAPATGADVQPLPGFQEVRPMVFASVYPVDTGDFAELNAAVEKLLLTDSSVAAERESSASLGMGLRCGFLGLLHMEVFLQRLQNEFNVPVISTAPSVPYRMELKTGEVVRAEKPSEFPPPHHVQRYFEPVVKATILTPQSSLGAVMKLLQDRRGTQVDMVFVDAEQVSLVYMVPWQEVVTDFFDRLKSITSGYASFEYEPAEEREADVVKVDLLLNRSPLQELSFVCHRDKAVATARAVCQKLRNVIARQQFEINIQAAIGVKVVAKERIPPFRKEVLVKSGKLVGGGDVTRKKKLLEKQKQGKARMKTVGKVQLSQSAFHSVVSR